MFRDLLKLLILLVLATPSLAAERQRQWANPDYWEFLGSLSLDVKTLRDALAVDIEVLLASRTPSHPEQLASTLAARLAAGYRHSGFPDVTVRSEVVEDRQRIALTVNEGSHYRNGEVLIEGARTVPIDELTEGLTEGTGPKDAFLRWTFPREQGGVKEWYKANGEKVEKEAAVWKKGNSTAFESGIEKSVATTAQLILQRCGFLDSSVTARLERQDDGKTTLVVQIEDEGPRAVLGEIEVHGNNINSPEQVLSYLEVEPGQPLDMNSAPRWQWKLQESARFYESKVDITPPPFGTGPSRLDIHLVEIPGQPSLSEPATPIQRASIQAAHWMTATKKEDWQLTVTQKIDSGSAASLPSAWQNADTVNLRWTLSAAESATIAEFDLRDADKKSLWAINFHFGGGQIQLLNLTRKAKISFPAVDTKMIVTALWMVRKPDELGRASLLTFGLGMNSQFSKQPRGPDVKTIVAPAAILIEAMRPEFQTTLADGVLKLVSGESQIEFDVETGRLRQFDAHAGDIELTFQLRAEMGLYRQRFQELSASYAACTEVLKDDALLTQTCRFFLDEWDVLGVAATEKQAEAVAVVRRLLNVGVLRGIDERLRPDHNTNEDAHAAAIDFEIPAPEFTGPVHPLAWLKPFMHFALAGYTKVFPRETGAGVAGREAALALVAGRRGAVPPDRVVQDLDEAAAGPLSFLLAAELFQFVSPYHRYVLSNAAMERLNSPAVRSDLRLLADERSLAGKVVLALTTALRDASPEDMAIIAGWMTKSQYDDVLQPAFRELSRRKDEPLSQVLPDVLEQVYPALIRPLLLAELQRLETSMRAANARPDLKPLALPETPFQGIGQKAKVPNPPEDLSKQQFLPKRD